MSFEVESGLEIPDRRGARGASRKISISSMKVGDSFAFEDGQFKNVRTAENGFGKRHSIKLITRFAYLANLMTRAALQMEIDKLTTALSDATRCHSVEKARSICSKALVEHALRKLASNHKRGGDHA